jgi:hypothetical protein
MDTNLVYIDRISGAVKLQNIHNVNPFTYSCLAYRMELNAYVV